MPLGGIDGLTVVDFPPGAWTRAGHIAQFEQAKYREGKCHQRFASQEQSRNQNPRSWNVGGASLEAQGGTGAAGQGRGSFPVNLVLLRALSGKSESPVEYSFWVGYCQLEVGIVP